MVVENNLFKWAVQTAVAATRTGSLIESKTAVVLERIARGGGATRWYYCSSKSCLALIEAKFSPGSVVSFYFDERIRQAVCSPEVRAAIERVIVQDREAVVGILGEDGLGIDVEIMSGPNELAEFLLNIKPATQVFYGAFPARDNDGEKAITLTLPDIDGMVRAHPH